jgi:hypothetical protein
MQEMDTRQNPDFIFRGPVQQVAPEPTPAAPTDLRSGLVKSWSYSALRDFEECQHRVFLGRVKKIKVESGAAADRGTEIHSQAESFINGSLEVLPEVLSTFAPELTQLREQFPAGNIELEGEWGFDADWQPTGWFEDNVWGRMKLDVFVKEQTSSARIIDFKTGKRFGNELKHAGQAQQYAIGAFMRYPELEFINVQFWYTDLKTDNIFSKNYTRQSALMFMPKLVERAAKLTTAQEFRPAPSKYTCRFCPFKDNGACEWAQ